MAKSKEQEIEVSVDPKNRFHDALNAKTPKPVFILESLSFNNVNATKNLNSNAMKSNECNNGKDARIFRCSEKSLSRPTANENETSLSDNADVQYQLVPDRRHSQPLLIKRPPFVLESLSFSASNSLVNADKWDASQTDLYNNENRNKAISTRDTSNCGNGKYSQSNIPVRRPFFVLESLSYKELGILRILSRNTSEGKTYKILPTKNEMIFRQSDEMINVTTRKQDKSIGSVCETDIPRSKCRKGPCSNTPGGKMWYKHAHLNNSEENEAINKCLLLETDPVHFKLLKTVRQPYVALEKLSN